MDDTKITVNLGLLQEQKIVVYDINRGITLLIRYLDINNVELYIMDKKHLETIIKQVTENHD